MSLEKSDLNQFLSINTKGGIRRPLHSVPHGGSGMNTGGAHNFIKVRAREMSGITEQGDLLKRLPH